LGPRTVTKWKAQSFKKLVEKSAPNNIRSEKDITIHDVYERQCAKEILATTALYGPWTPKGEFDWASYENLVRKVMRSGSVPATNVDTTWAIYNDWELTKKLIWRTVEIATDLADTLGENRPLVVAGLNTNPFDIKAQEIAPTLRALIEELNAGLKGKGLTDRIRYMPVPDKRLYNAPTDLKIQTYNEIGQVVGDFTDFGFVFFELDIGIEGFGSNFSPPEIEEILATTEQIQEYKSALINRKRKWVCQYDYCDDMVRIDIVEKTAPARIQFSTGNDWFIALARYGKYIKNFGYLLGASQLSPDLFKLWRDFVKEEKACSLAIEHDLQAAAKDFWTPGNVGIYRHYMGIFLAMTGLIDYPLPHPKCEDRYKVIPQDYFLPLKHALRLGLLDQRDAKTVVRTMVPGCENWTDGEINRRIEFMS
jgi:hypothetical protein